jgi:8-oxo-dGTP diphosphatase
MKIKRDAMPLERPVLAVDVVLLRILDGHLHVLLHVRQEEPFVGVRALPGVALRVDETLLSAGRRALEKTGLPRSRIEQLFIEQLATFDALYRDPRGRTVSVAHLGLCLDPGDVDRAVGAWAPVRGLREHLPFDHGHIVDTAVERLRGKLRYTNIAARLLPDTFRIEALQSVYEAILGRRLNRANFRTKLLRIGLIELVGVSTEAVGRRGGRPPHLYRFTSGELSPEDRDFV